jgi:hypothetical protein
LELVLFSWLNILGPFLFSHFIRSSLYVRLSLGLCASRKLDKNEGNSVKDFSLASTTLATSYPSAADFLQALPLSGSLLGLDVKVTHSGPTDFPLIGKNHRLQSLFHTSHAGAHLPFLRTCQRNYDDAAN